MSAKADAVRSGGGAPKSGLYLAANHYHEGMRLELLVQAGDLLPKCSECNREMDWKYLGEFNRTTMVVL